MDFKLTFFIFAIVNVVVSDSKTYSNHKVYNVVPKTNEDVKVLEELKKFGGVEFWEEKLVINHQSKIMTAPEHRDEIEKVFTENNIEFKLVIEDVQKLIDEQLKPIRRSARSGTFNFEQYHSLEEINNWLDHLAETYPDVVTISVLGQSIEGREIKGIKLDFRPEETENRLISMLEGANHAREWISPASIIWLTNEFLNSNDEGVRSLAETFVWHIFPVVNPDGYLYTFTTNRMWRKNRNTASFTSCAASGADDDMSNGVDLNRNYNYVWNSAGTSSDPCSNLYPGTAPFSEPEARALSNYVLNLQSQGQLVYYFAIHSYTQLLLIPYSHVAGGHDSLMSGNYGDMYELAIRGAEVISQKSGTRYSVGLSADLMYEMSGTTFDWVKAATNVRMSYLFELRDLGEFGFLLPADQIVPTASEILDALVEMHKTGEKLGYYTTAGANGVLASVTVLISGFLVSLFV